LNYLYFTKTKDTTFNHLFSELKSEA